MTRLPKLFATLLTLALGASGGVASLAATCTHVADAPAATSHARHDCCHAAHAHAHAATHDGMSAPTAHAPATDDRTVATHEEDCAAGHERNAPQVASFGDDNAPCAGCCAERAAVQPRVLATPGTQKIERAADSRAAHAPHSFLSSAPLHTTFAPTQHAPPHASARLHMLISVLLI